LQFTHSVYVIDRTNTNTRSETIALPGPRKWSLIKQMYRSSRIRTAPGESFWVYARRTDIFCSNIARSAHNEVQDHHHRTVAAAIRKLLPPDWKRPPGRPNHTRLRATESDLRLLNIGPSYAWKKAASREQWRSTVDTATLKKSMP